MDVPNASDAAPPPSMIWFEAIATRRCVRATYNGVEAKLAPHNLYARAGQLYVAAVALERRELPITERKVGIFAVAGLRECALDEETFEVEASYDPADPRYATSSLFAIDL